MHTEETRHNNIIMRTTEKQITIRSYMTLVYGPLRGFNVLLFIRRDEYYINNRNSRVSIRLHIKTREGRGEVAASGMSHETIYVRIKILNSFFANNNFRVYKIRYSLGCTSFLRTSRKNDRNDNTNTDLESLQWNNRTCIIFQNY